MTLHRRALAAAQTHAADLRAGRLAPEDMPRGILASILPPAVPKQRLPTLAAPQKVSLPDECTTLGVAGDTLFGLASDQQTQCTISDGQSWTTSPLVTEEFSSLRGLPGTDMSAVGVLGDQLVLLSPEDDRLVSVSTAGSADQILAAAASGGSTHALVTDGELTNLWECVGGDWMMGGIPQGFPPLPSSAALTVYRGQLVLAWTDEDGNVTVACFDGSAWSTLALPQPITGAGSLGLSVLDDWLVLCWVQDQQVMSVVSDGVQVSEPTVLVAGEAVLDDLVTFQGQLRLLCGQSVYGVTWSPTLPAGQVLSSTSALTLTNGPVAFSSGDFTIEGWLQRNQPGTVLSWGNKSASLSVAVDSRGIVTVTLNGVSGECTLTSTSLTLLDGPWHHLAVMRSSQDGTLSLLMDGLVVASCSIDATVDLGTASGLLTLSGVGLYRELRVWSCARGRYAIDAALFHVPPLGAPDLLARWAFDGDLTNTLNPMSLSGGSFVPAEFCMVGAATPYVTVQSRRMQGVQEWNGDLVTEWRTAFSAFTAQGTPYLNGLSPGLGCWFLLWSPVQQQVRVRDTSYTIGPDQPAWVQANGRGRLNVCVAVDPSTPYCCPPLLARAEFMGSGAVVAFPDRRLHQTLRTITAEQLAEAALFSGDDCAQRCEAAASMLNTLFSAVLPHDLEQNSQVTEDAGPAQMAARRSAAGRALVNTTPAGQSWLAVDLPVVAADVDSDVVRATFLGDEAPGNEALVNRLVNPNTMLQPVWSIDATSAVFSTDVTPQPASRRATGLAPQEIRKADTLTFQGLEDKLLLTVGRGARTQAMDIVTVDDAMTAAAAGLEALDAETDGFWDWLSWVFDLGDMQQNAKDATAVMEAICDGLVSSISDLKKQVDSALDSAPAKISQTIAGWKTTIEQLLEPGGESRTVGSQSYQGGSLPAETIADEGTESLTSADDAFGEPPGSDSISSVESAVMGSSHKGAAQAAATGPGFLSAVSDPNALLESGLVWLLDELESVLLAVVPFVADIVDSVFSAVLALVGDLKGLLFDSAIEIPVGTWLLRKLLDVDTLRVVDLLSFCGASFATIGAKLLGGLEGRLVSAGDLKALTTRLRGGSAAMAAVDLPRERKVSDTGLRGLSYVLGGVAMVASAIWGVFQFMADSVEGPAAKLSGGVVLCETVAFLASYPLDTASPVYDSDFSMWASLLVPLFADSMSWEGARSGVKGNLGGTVGSLMSGVMGIVHAALWIAHGVMGIVAYAKKGDSWGIADRVLMMLQNLFGAVAELAQLANLAKRKVLNQIMDIIGFELMVVFGGVRLVVSIASASVLELR